jgi:hypothetical protein
MSLWRRILTRPSLGGQTSPQGYCLGTPVSFKYIDYLKSVISDPEASPEQRGAALDELKRREEIRTTVHFLTLTAFLGLIVVIIAQWLAGTIGDTDHDRTTHLLPPAVTQPAPPATESHPATETQPQTNIQPTTMVAATETVVESITSDLSQTPAWLHAFARALVAGLWALAWFVSGILLGFLFGIPKIQQAEHPSSQTAVTPSTPSPDYRQQINTNLEQISDWLTKIIVGLGLVQLRQLPGYLALLANYMTDPNCGVACPPFAATIIIAFVILGFLTGYLLTRMFLAAAFARADQVTPSSGLFKKKIDLVLSKHAGPADTDQLPGVGAGSSPASTDPAIQAAVWSIVASPRMANEPFEQRWARAKAKILESRFPEAAAEYADLVRNTPANLRLRLDYAWALFKKAQAWSPELQAQVDAAFNLNPARGSDDRKALFESLTFYSLYRPPEGYLDAIRFGEQYVQEPGNISSATVWTNLACAYGQKSKTVIETTERSRIRGLALDAVKHAVTLAPAVAKVLQAELLGRDPQENDLAVFATDPEFRAAVLLGPTDQTESMGPIYQADAPQPTSPPKGEAEPS